MVGMVSNPENLALKISLDSVVYVDFTDKEAHVSK